MATLYRRGAVWWADFRDPRGRRRRESLRTTDAKVARERLRRAELVATDPAAHREERPLSAAIGYFVDVALSGVPAGTVRFYKGKVGHLFRIFGAVDVADIRKPDVLAYAQQRLAEGAHRHTVGKELITLRRVLVAEHERVALPVPPRDLIPKWKMEYAPRTRHLSRLDFERLMVKTPAARRLWLMVAAYTGGSFGELVRLEWHHVDLDRGLIHLPGTKAKDRRRTVPLADPLRPWLFGAKQRTGRVLAKWHNVRRDLAHYCAKAKIPKVTPNDLRRTFASWLVDAGVPHLTVAHLLGHSSTRMVEKVYGRLDRGHYAAAVSKLPGCDVGVSDNGPRMAPGGVIGTGAERYNDANTADLRVPRDGVEPPTRGFSGQASPHRNARRGAMLRRPARLDHDDCDADVSRPAIRRRAR